MNPSKPMPQAVDELPGESVTVMALKGLDFVVPGEWQNLVGFDNTIRAVTGESSPAQVQKIREHALRLYNDPAQGYQRALWLYQTVDVMDMALGAAALAQKAGEMIPLLSFLNKVTPKADTTQAVDLALKLIAEGAAYCLLNGLPTQNMGQFVDSLKQYAGASIMRMAALICVDGLIPLGPDFLIGTQNVIGRLTPGELERNEMFQRISSLIPGASAGDKLGFIGNGFSAAQGWLNQFVAARGLNPQKVLGSMRKFIDIADDKLDYVGAFLDLTTNYYAHTGTQTVARSLIEEAVKAG
ncbi:MAG TPA: hypothetical protein VI793_03665 [Anaerolineales bacterium]|nr:hypothetical protein [Anaerolineales bacterium]